MSEWKNTESANGRISEFESLHSLILPFSDPAGLRPCRSLGEPLLIAIRLSGDGVAPSQFSFAASPFRSFFRSFADSAILVFLAQGGLCEQTCIERRRPCPQ